MAKINILARAGNGTQLVQNSELISWKDRFVITAEILPRRVSESRRG
jgi:hypothetical protein